MATLPDLSQLSREQLEAALRAATAPKAISLKVSEKGCVSVYGMGRFPTTLYAGQWERLAGEMPRILAFIKANEANVSRK